MAELDRDFRRFVLDLFKTITSPKNIVIKKVGGKELTCRELCRAHGSFCGEDERI